MSLFDSYKLARIGHPATSHQAAADIAEHVGELTAWAAACVADHPGSTANELAKVFSQDDTRRIGKRLDGAVKAGLLRRGIVRRCRVSGRACTTWWPRETQ